MYKLTKEDLLEIIKTFTLDDFEEIEEIRDDLLEVQRLDQIYNENELRRINRVEKNKSENTTNKR